MTFDGETITIIRKSIKNLHLRIKLPDGKIEISCPLRMPDSQIEAFVREKAQWIRKHRQAVLASASIPKPQGLTGETVLLWGKEYPLRVSIGSPSVSLQENTVLLTVPENTTAEQRMECLAFWHRENLRLAVEKRMPYWERLTGLTCSRWFIRDMKTRWGSCTPKTAAIRINLRLAEKPVECLDYLLLHELTHIRHPNHSDAFYRDIAALMPDWKSRRMLLNGRNADE